VLALMREYYNGNKSGMRGIYRFRPDQRLIDFPPEGEYLYDPTQSYLGHNIACIAVDGSGEVIDFEFNHNDVYNSSMEHAESRLVRRVFSLTQIYDEWYTTGSSKLDYSKVMERVTIFTSLESCAQCAGIMALAGVRDVVYLQVDPGMSAIGNILYHLTRSEDGKPAPGKITAPYPLSASAFDFKYTRDLEAGYEEFRRTVSQNNPFFTGAGLKSSFSPSITSFLCTDTALGIIDQAYQELMDKLERFERVRAELGVALTELDELDELRLAFGDGAGRVRSDRVWEKLGDSLQEAGILSYPNYRPPILGRDLQPVPEEEGRVALTNAAVLRNIQRFWIYAQRPGHRGTPHKI
jgi:tRNA(Arg) A34 adenosine deaminase TadA